VSDREIEVRMAAATALGEFGARAKASVPALVGVLKSPASYPNDWGWSGNPWFFANLLGTRAAYSLSRIGSDACPGLTEVLLDTRAPKTPRFVAGDALLQIGARAANVALLAKGLDDPDEDIRKY